MKTTWKNKHPLEMTDEEFSEYLTYVDAQTKKLTKKKNSLGANNKYIFKSRYNQERVLKFENNEWTLTGESHFTRGSKGFFDFEGGPAVYVGEKLGSIVEVKPEHDVEILGFEKIPGGIKLITK